jgi:hypothetical protein
MKRKTPAAVDYGPTPTSLASGNVQRDAEYVLALPTKPRRHHELWRLGHIHGYEHKSAVEKRVLEIWDSKRNAN